MRTHAGERAEAHSVAHAERSRTVGHRWWAGACCRHRARGAGGMRATMAGGGQDDEQACVVDVADGVLVK